MLKGGIELMSTYIENDVVDKLDLNIEIDDDDVKQRLFTFYVIENVSPDDEYNCTIISGGCPFYILESADSVNKKIKERQNFLYN